MLRLLVFFSGFSGLIYEVVWAEDLAVLFGNTAVAHAAVLASFLGGMAAGYAGLGPISDRVDDPLDFYGRLEIGIGLCGVLAPRVFASASAWFAPVFLLIPTALMGGTLPALVRAAAVRGADSGEGLSGFYGINSVGAAFGVVFAGFWAIANLGLALSSSVAAIINVGVGLGALALSRWGPTAGATFAADRAPGFPPTTGRVRTALLAAAFLSGFAALCYEIGWIRLLALVLGASTYSFTVMLASFVAGIALGAAVMRRWIGRIRKPVFVFAALQSALGIAVLAGTPFYPKLAFLFHWWAAQVPRVPEAFFLYEAGKCAFCFAVMLVPAALLGAGLPVAAAADSRGEKIGAGIGRVFGLNTLGNVIGALTAGLVLMPLLGLRGLLSAAAALNLTAGFALFAALAERRAARWGGAALVAGTLFAVFGGPWDRGELISGSYLHRLNAPALTRAEFAEQKQEAKILYYRDGANATVAVTHGWEILQLRVNGKVDATDGLDMTTQIMLAQTPLLLRPEAKQVLVIGLGSGVSAAAALTHPVDQVTVAEISRGVVEGAALFEKANGGVLRNPRLNLRVTDGRLLLAREEKRYDVIVSEPSNPWMAGISDLYTREFFEMARSRLNKRGLFVQWLHTYFMTDDMLRLVIRTVAVVFPDVQVWTLGRDILIVAGEGGVEVDLDAAAARMRAPAVRRSLAGALISTPASFFALHAYDDAHARGIAGWPGPINEDGFPLLEYAAPKGVFLGGRSELLDRNDSRMEPDPNRRLLLTRWLAHTGELTPEDFDVLFQFHWTFKSAFAGKVLLEWARHYPNDEKVREMLVKFAEAADQRGLPEKAKQIRALLGPRRG